MKISEATTTVAVPDLFDTIRRVVAVADRHNGRERIEVERRILKVFEEAGEAATAVIGTAGQNWRKGVTHTDDDVVAELGDVVITALVAIASLDREPARVLAETLVKVGSRLDVEAGKAPTDV